MEKNTWKEPYCNYGFNELNAEHVKSKLNKAVLINTAAVKS